MLLTMLLSSIDSNAQLKVLSNGKVLMGAPMQANALNPNMIPNVQILGTIVSIPRVLTNRLNINSCKFKYYI